MASYLDPLITDEYPDPRTEALMTPGEQVLTLDHLLGRPAWYSDAACTGSGPDLFHPGHGGNYDQARDLCTTCPVADLCLDHVLAIEELDRRRVGMWAGTTPKEREAIAKTRRLIRSPGTIKVPRTPTAA